MRHEYEEKAQLERELERESHIDHEHRDARPSYYEHYDHQDYDDDRYDAERLEPVDLDALRAIHERIAPRHEREAVRERIDRGDVYTLAHSLDFAEQ